MKVWLVRRDSARATVRVAPGWFGRLLGARGGFLDLEWCEGETFAGWVVVGSYRRLVDTRWARAVQDALDYVPVGDLPRAVARCQKLSAGW